MNVIEFAVGETLKAYPHLTREEAIHLFTDYIENNLPQIVRGIELPNVYIVKRIEEEKLKRIKRARRETEVEKAEKKLQFIDALYKLKELSNGNGRISYTTAPIAYEAWTSTTITIPMPIPSDTGLEKIGNGKNQDRIDVRFPLEKGTLKEPEFLRRLEGTSVRKSLEVLPTLERITEDVEVLRKKTDENFGIIIDEVKSAIEKLPELRDEEYYTEIFLRCDVELPEWEQTIIKFKIENKTFDEKMKLWDEIDSRLRKVIKTVRDEAIRKSIDPVEIDKINKNLFVDLELV